MRMKQTIGPTRKVVRSFPEVGKTTVKSKPSLQKSAEKIVSANKLREAMAKEPLTTILKLATAEAKRRKRVEGATGINLMPTDTREASISSAAVGDITMSASAFMYRTPRKNVDDVVKYQMNRQITHELNGSVDAAAVFDINVLDARAVKGNPSSDEDYSHLTIEKAFDKLLLGETQDKDGTAFVGRVQQQSIHVKSLTIDLTLANLLESGVFVDLYELVPQHTIGPSEYYNTNYSTGYMSPTWTYASSLAGTDTIFPQDIMNYGELAANPASSTNFSRTWKQVKRLRLNLGDKAVHRHKAVYSINKTVSYQEFAQFSPDGGKFAGWNPTFMLVAKGAPTGGSEAASTSMRYTCNMQLNYESSPDRQSKVIVFDTNA